MHEATHITKHVVVGVHRAKKIALADSSSGCASDINLPFPALDGDGAEILYIGFRTVSGAARCGELHLVWRFDSLKSPLDLLRQRDGVSNAIAAKIRADTAFASAE